MKNNKPAWPESTAQKAMGQGFETTYFPDEVNAKKYEEIYLNYVKIGKFIENEL